MILSTIGLLNNALLLKMKRFKQTLLLDETGLLVESCDSLFLANNLKGQSMTMYFPFLESVFDDLLIKLELNHTVIFPGVETKHEFLPGYYDYVFTSVRKNGEALIEWQILDATDEYTQVKQEQQSFNEEKAFLDSSI
jgi:hypothetical protein